MTVYTLAIAFLGAGLAFACAAAVPADWKTATIFMVAYLTGRASEAFDRWQGRR